ncbi:hypothetical protein FRB95_003226, partial [Tulasnella sp. JGI-2019a]
IEDPIAITPATFNSVTSNLACSAAADIIRSLFDRPSSFAVHELHAFPHHRIAAAPRTPPNPVSITHYENITTMLFLDCARLLALYEQHLRRRFPEFVSHFASHHGHDKVNEMLETRGFFSLSLRFVGYAIVNLRIGAEPTFGAIGLNTEE